MSLHDELVDLAYKQISQDPAGKLFLDGGEEALMEAGFGMADILRVLNLVLMTHREQILRLADEIDALKQQST